MHPEAASKFQLLESDLHHLKAAAGNFLFMIWRRETQAAAFTRGVGLARELGKRQGAKIGVCQVVELEAVPPDAEARRAFQQLLELDCVAHSSVIHDGTGFKAASVRAIVNLQILLTKPKFPHRVFGSVQEAAAFHAASEAPLGRKLEQEDFGHWVAELRALHRARFP